MQKLSTVPNESQAVFVRSLLKNSNIRVFIASSPSSMFPKINGVNNGIVPYDIFVHEEDVERALGLVKEWVR